MCVVRRFQNHLCCHFQPQNIKKFIVEHKHILSLGLLVFFIALLLRRVGRHEALQEHFEDSDTHRGTAHM